MSLFPEANHVRLVLDWYSAGACYTDSFSPDPSTGYLAPAWLKYMDDAVEWVTSAGLWITITMRNNIGTNSPHGKAPPMPCSADYILNTTLRDMWFEAWKFIAHRYRGVDRIAWYEPASEPHLRPVFKEKQCEHTNEDVMQLLGSVIAAIREVDADTPVAISPEYNACPGLGIAQKLNDTQVIYALNWWCNQKVAYGADTTCGAVFGQIQSPCVRACAGYTKTNDPPVKYNRTTLIDLFNAAAAFQDRHKVPVWVDQLGCPSAAPGGAKNWLRDSMDLFDGRGLHWSWWTWRGGSMGVLQPPCDTNQCKKDVDHYQLDRGNVALIAGAFESSSLSQNRYDIRADPEL